jgi:flagellar biosynthesis protein FliR
VGFEEYWLLVLLATARIGSFLFMLPFFRGQGIPAMAKGSLAVSLGMFSAFQMKPVEVGGMPDLIIHILIEVLIGLTLAYSVEVVVAIIKMAGAMIDMDIGLANPIFDPMTGEASTVISRIFFSFFITIFIAMNGVSYFISGIIQTFQLTIPDELFGKESFLEFLIDIMNYMFLGAVQIAFPFMFATFLVNLTLLFMGKSVDKINIFINMFGIKILVGLVLVAISVPILTTVFQQVYEGLDEQYIETIRMLFGK